MSTEICSIRVTKEEKEAIKRYAQINNITVSSALKKPFFDMLEDEYDIKICDERYNDYLKSGKKSYSFEEVMKKMAYELRFTDNSFKEFNKFDNNVKYMIKKWIEKHLLNVEDPRTSGKPLKGDLSNFWRYRIGDYRLLCLINDKEFIVLAVKNGHRREVYC